MRFLLCKRFGGGYRSLKTGIIYNNEMDDFSTPGKSNLYGYPPTEANYIRPKKRPLSSMCPSIITDQNGDVKMVAGASGGSRIITGTAQVSYFLLHLKLGLFSSRGFYLEQYVIGLWKWSPSYLLPRTAAWGVSVESSFHQADLTECMFLLQR